MMGDHTIRGDTRAKVRQLCLEAGVKDLSGNFKTEEAAETFMQELQLRTATVPPSPHSMRELKGQFS